MKRTLIAIAAIAALSGCAGLSVNIDGQFSYRSDVIPGTRIPMPTTLPKAAPVVPGAPS